MFEVPLTAAANCVVAPMTVDALAGLTVIATVVGGVSDADSKTMAVADLVGSATLVAVTMTVCSDGMEEGAV